MPGWPAVDRGDDQQVVQALRDGAVERLYDSYAERLHDYACSLLGERDAATDSVHDALVTAHGCVSRLKEIAKLRAWLYALTRFQAMARLNHRGSGDSVPLPAFDEPEDPELYSLVHEALGEMSRNEREVLELSLRHGLTPAEVGSVLGLTSRQAASRLGRARDHLENGAAAVVLARTGRAHCPDLSAMLDSWEGPLTSRLRRRLSGHISGCEVCTEGRHRQVPAERLLDLVPVAFPPISLRHRVVDTCLNPERGQTRTLITDRGDTFDRLGFPVAAERRTRRRRSRRLGPVLLAGAAVLAATGAMVVMNNEDPAKTALRVAPVPALSPSATPPDESTDESTPESTPESVAEDDDTTPTPTPKRTPSARPAPTVSASRPATAPRATRRQVVRAARLSLSCPAGFESAVKIGLRARNATVTWSATASQGLGVLPASGSIRAGGSVMVVVTVDDPDSDGSGSVSFSSNGGRAHCSLSWRGAQQPSDPPDDQPTTTQGPTDPPSSPADSAAVASLDPS